MSTLLDTFEPPETTTTRSFGEQLQADMAAVRLQLRWFGTRKSVSASQKREAAETFDAESKFVSMCGGPLKLDRAISYTTEIRTA